MKTPQINVQIPKTDIHGNLPSIGTLLDPNANIDINAPKIDIPKIYIDVSRIDIHGPSMDIFNELLLDFFIRKFLSGGCREKEIYTFITLFYSILLYKIYT